MAKKKTKKKAIKAIKKIKTKKAGKSKALEILEKINSKDLNNALKRLKQKLKEKEQISKAHKINAEKLQTSLEEITVPSMQELKKQKA